MVSFKNRINLLFKDDAEELKKKHFTKPLPKHLEVTVFISSKIMMII